MGLDKSLEGYSVSAAALHLSSELMEAEKIAEYVSDFVDSALSAAEISSSLNVGIGNVISGTPAAAIGLSNTVYSPYCTAEGCNAVAGGRAYRFQDLCIAGDDAYFVLSDDYNGELADYADLSAAIKDHQKVGNPGPAVTYSLQAPFRGAGIQVLLDVGECIAVELSSYVDEETGEVKFIRPYLLYVDKVPALQINNDLTSSLHANKKSYDYIWFNSFPQIGAVDICRDIGGAHAEGLDSIALQYGSHAEGNETKAIGRYAHAEGNATIATHAAHSEGQQTSALGTRSHAEGYMTSTGLLDQSLVSVDVHAGHAEGVYTRAEGRISHAAGLYAIASADVSYVWNGHNGKYSASSSTMDLSAKHDNGPGTYSIYPAEGLSGFYVAGQRFSDLLSSVGSEAADEVKAEVNAVKKQVAGMQRALENLVDATVVQYVDGDVAFYAGDGTEFSFEQAASPTEWQKKYLLNVKKLQSGYDALSAGAFEECSALALVNAENVHSVGAGAFTECRELSAIDLRGVTSADYSEDWNLSVMEADVTFAEGTAKAADLWQGDIGGNTQFHVYSNPGPWVGRYFHGWARKSAEISDDTTYCFPGIPDWYPLSDMQQLKLSEHWLSASDTVTAGSKLSSMSALIELTANGIQKATSNFFNGDRILKHVEMNSLTAFPVAMFNTCSALESVKLPANRFTCEDAGVWNNAKSMLYFAMPSVKNVELSSSRSLSIAAGAIYGTTQTESFTLSTFNGSPVAINRTAFHSSSNLTSICIPNLSACMNISSDAGAINSCPNLKLIDFRGRDPSLSSAPPTMFNSDRGLFTRFSIASGSLPAEFKILIDTPAGLDSAQTSEYLNQWKNADIFSIDHNAMVYKDESNNWVTRPLDLSPYVQLG